MKNISVLGATGSIGTSTLDVIRRNQTQFSVTALSAGRNLPLLKNQIDEFGPKVVSVIDKRHADELREMLGRSCETEILFGIEGYREAATLREVDMVVSAIVGAAGLVPTVDAIEAGKDIALANKETMVMAGKLVVEKASSRGVKIIPVDSEHSAIFQCISGHNKKDIRRIILTASGGPFFKLDRDKLSDVTPDDALKHPKWDMGNKITIDSATMMNKGLEVIEAKWLFGVDIERIEIIVHPQSIVHSMVEYIDGSLIGQLGLPDMRGPISYALFYPEREGVVEPALNLAEVEKLEFFPPDFDMFPSIGLAYEAAKKGGVMPAVLNASNEVAVAAFLSREIRFTEIPRVVEKTLDFNIPSDPESLEDVLMADEWGRSKAQKIIEDIKKGS
jgi:1-deoxy-D-xylulose-5-phosphate reductoisomerase